MKKILITGAGSFVGTSFEKYIKDNYADRYEVEAIEMRDGSWREKNFSGYDVVYHVAGIAHSDNGKISTEKEKLYRSVNTDLAIEVAKKAKAEGINIGTAQGLDILPKTAKFLKNEDIKFVIVGDGRYLSTLAKEINDNEVNEKFILIPRQPAQRIPELLSACDAAFISFQDNPLWTKTIPAKLQSYMACGMPIIAAAQGETSRIIEEAGCGMCCDIGDVNALADLIRTMKSVDLLGFGLNSRKYCEEHFNKNNLMDEMDNYFNK